MRFILAMILLSVGWLAAQECEDGLCKEEESMDVLCPVGEERVQPVRQAARLDTLQGKTIALVGGSFMARVTHPELKRLILAKYPQAHVIMLGEIGSAGPWPASGVKRRQKEEFMAALREKHVDAVVSGNGGCGLCTPREMGSCIAAEHAGLPSVMIAAPGFVAQAKSTARAAGVRIARVAVYPGAFASDTEQQLIENTRKVLWPQIEKALTTPFTEVEKAEVTRNTGAVQKGIVFSGSVAEVNRYFASMGWTDGLPVLPPTPQAVAEFLRFSDAEPGTPVAVVPPSQRVVTVQQVAVNGVMAGCPPEFMPVLVALTQALCDGNFRRTLSSTHAWNPYCWLGGPISRQLALDHAQGEISAQRNAVLGRFMNLALINFGGYDVKKNRMGTFGYLMPWCLAEDEETTLRLGWRTHQMQCGFAVNDNTLTVASALCWGNNLSPATTDAQKIVELLAWEATQKQQFALGSGMPFVYRVFLITEPVAQDLMHGGFLSKEKLEGAIIRLARVPLQERAFANYYANPGSSFNPSSYPFHRHVARISHNENAQNTPTPPWLAWTKQQSTCTVPVMQQGKTAILVTGDANRNKAMCLPGGAWAARRIVLPRAWDSLMEQRGYAPLRSFYINASPKTSSDTKAGIQSRQDRHSTAESDSPRNSLSPMRFFNGLRRRFDHR